MGEVVVAGLVGAGLGYVVRFSQEQIQRAVRGWARNELVAGSARRGRDVVVTGVRSGVQLARAGARGGTIVAGVAAGQVTSTVRRRGIGRPAPARAVRVPVGETAPGRRRTSTRTSERQPTPRRRATQRREAAPGRQATSSPRAAGRSETQTEP